MFDQKDGYWFSLKELPEWPFNGVFEKLKMHLFTGPHYWSVWNPAPYAAIQALSSLPDHVLFKQLRDTWRYTQKNIDEKFTRFRQEFKCGNEKIELLHHANGEDLWQFREKLFEWGIGQVYLNKGGESVNDIFLPLAKSKQVVTRFIIWHFYEKINGCYDVQSLAKKKNANEFEYFFDQNEVREMYLEILEDTTKMSFPEKAAVARIEKGRQLTNDETRRIYEEHKGH